MNPFAAPVDPALCASWMDAARGPLAEEINKSYEDIGDEIAKQRPVCTGSGRCCHFERFDHMLLTTGLEAAYAIANLPDDVGLDEGSLRAAVGMGTCPFLVGKMCVAHQVKPGACRVFFCDPTREDAMQDLGDRHANAVRVLHKQHGIEYRYATWDVLLDAFVRAGFTRPPRLNGPGRIGLRVLDASRGQAST